MLAFYPDVIRPILDALRPRVIVEVGAEHGKMTRLLLDHATKDQSVVHTIDPHPQLSPAILQMVGPRLVLHRAMSLQVLPKIDSPDVVLLDGDHNWYTVYHELKCLASGASNRGEMFPLVFLHDVGWPYGRRDLYYDPATVPAEHRLPHARAGMTLTASELAPSGGINAHLIHATHEGGPKNGVMTALEDFLQQTKLDLEYFVIPAAFGLAVLGPRPLLRDSQSPIADLVAPWLDPRVYAFINRLELARLSLMSF